MIKKYCKHKGKICSHFENEIEGQLAVLEGKRKHKNKCDRVPLRVYKCQCGSYHLTSSEATMSGEYFSHKEKIIDKKS